MRVSVAAIQASRWKENQGTLKFGNSQLIASVVLANTANNGNEAQRARDVAEGRKISG